MAWPDFDAYLSHLRASARKDYRKHCQRAARLGIEMRRYAQPPDLPAAMRLIGNVERRFGSPRPWARRALENLGMAAGAWISAEQAGEAVAGGLYLRDGQGAMLTLMGRDYTVPYAYFQLFYEEIACAIEDGVCVLHGGSDAYEFKERLGFEVVANNHVVYAATSPGLAWLARRATGG